MTKKELMVKAHKMTKEIKSQYPTVNYKFQLGLCLSYLQNEGENRMVELKGSEKQIAWAEKIRKEVRGEILEALEKTEFTTNGQLKAASKIKEDMENESAAFWIENFKSYNYGETSLDEYLNQSIAAKRIFKVLLAKRENL